MYMRLLTLFFTVASSPLFLPVVLPAHDGRLDLYGCHYDEDHKYYHCHQGTYMGLSFDSKTQMIKRLRNQHIALGRPWPYGNAINDYEQHIASSSLAKTEPKARLRDYRKQNSETLYTQVNQSPQRTPVKQTATLTKTKSSRPITSHAEIDTNKNKVAQPTSAERHRSDPARNRTEPELKVWITRIRSDGRAIFENLEGERFVLDDSGNKVVVGQPNL